MYEYIQSENLKGLLCLQQGQKPVVTILRTTRNGTI